MNGWLDLLCMSRWVNGWLGLLWSEGKGSGVLSESGSVQIHSEYSTTQNALNMVNILTLPAQVF